MSDALYKDPQPIGQAWLRRELNLPVPPAGSESYVVAGARRTEAHGANAVEFYPRQYATDSTVVAHLRFALRHEPLDLGVIAATMKAIDAANLEDWLRREPTGGFSRRAWFFFELFTGCLLDIPDARTGNYVEALDPTRHFVAERRNSVRHRVSDNLLGDASLCPTVRRTAKLEAQITAQIDHEARALTERYDPITLARAISYLYTKETRSSFAIEGETLTPARSDRFVSVLRAAPAFNLDDAAALIRLQGEIVDPRYAAQGWRNFQNFVGETVGGYREKVHFICPRPEAVPDLMAGWARLTQRLLQSRVEPVISAAVSAFSFVFIHPFEDGNGRLHRFLIHAILAKQNFSPPDIVFPVSAAILRDRRRYDEALEAFSGALTPFIFWDWTSDQEISVKNNTDDLYRYFDATAQAEYLYDRVADTIHRDLKEELCFVAVFDRALAGVSNVVDMPDRRASLFVRLCLQNGGRLAGGRRTTFPELTDGEIAAMEEAVQAATAIEAGEPKQPGVDTGIRT
jgi:hypothetical protein